MKYILSLLVAVSFSAVAKDKPAKTGRGPASEVGNVSGEDVSKFKPTSVVTDDNVMLGDDAEAEGASWHFVKKDEHPATKAVGQLFGSDGARCTTTVITPPAAKCSDPSKMKPKMISNGHCSLKNMGEFTARFNGFEGVPANKRPEISAKKLYSTENRMDVGVYELDTTYDQLGKFGIEPVAIAQSMSENSYSNLSMPLQNVTEENRNMRLNPNCVPEKQTTMIDQYRFYTGITAFKNCSAIGGSSGSGLFNAKGELAGLMVAGILPEKAKPPQHECSIDTCVYDGEGNPTRYESNFGFDITYLNKCFKGCDFDFKAPGCPLPDPDSGFGTIITSQDPVWTTTLENTINFVNRKFSKLHVKMCTNAMTCSCQDEKGYVPGPTGTLNNGKYGYSVKPSDYMPAGSKIKAKEGEPATFQFLCIRGESPDGQLDDLKNTTNYPQWLYNKGSIFKLPKK